AVRLLPVDQDFVAGGYWPDPENNVDGLRSPTVDRILVPLPGNMRLQNPAVQQHHVLLLKMGSFPVLPKPWPVRYRAVEPLGQQCEIAEAMESRIALGLRQPARQRPVLGPGLRHQVLDGVRSEEHTSELQSRE